MSHLSHPQDAQEIAPSDLLITDEQSLGTVLSGSRRIPTTGHDLGTRLRCPTCGDEMELRQTIPNAQGRTMRYWTDCSCWRARCDYIGSLSGAPSAQQQVAQRVDQVDDLAAVAHLTLDRFGAKRLSGGEAHPLTAATRWIAQITSLPVADYHKGPPAALFFHSKGKGRGKTHLAAGLALQA
jgi:hypothetical protein